MRFLAFFGRGEEATWGFAGSGLGDTGADEPSMIVNSTHSLKYTFSL